MPAQVKALVIKLKQLLDSADLSYQQVSDQHGLQLSPQAFGDQFRRLSGPSPEVYKAIVQCAAKALDRPFTELQSEMRPLHDPVYLKGKNAAAATEPPVVAAPAHAATPAQLIDLRVPAKWLVELLRNARETEAVAGLDEHFLGNNTALASVLVDLAESDRFAVGLFLDAIGKVDQSRVTVICQAITEIDERAAAAIFDVCDPPADAQDADKAVGEPSLVDYDPDFGAGQRIAALLDQKRETGRIVREVRMRVEADMALVERSEHREYIRRTKHTWPRPKCSKAFQRLIFGITLYDTIRGPRWLADLLLALYTEGDFVSLSHCVTALFDLRQQYGKPVFLAASRVFENMTTDAVLQILSGICTEARLYDEVDGEATFVDLEALLWALDDVDLVLVTQKVAKLPPTAELSAGHLVDFLPNISSFWRRLLAGPDGHLAGVLLERALTDWMGRDHGTPLSGDYPPLRAIANALVDVDAAHRARRSPHRETQNSPVTIMTKRLLTDRPAAAVLLLQAMLLDQHPRMYGLLHTLVSDTEALHALAQTILLAPSNLESLRLFELVSIELPEVAGPLCSAVATDFPVHTQRVLDERLASVPTLSSALLTVLAGREPGGPWLTALERLRVNDLAGASTALGILAGGTR